MIFVCIDPHTKCYGIVVGRDMDRVVGAFTVPFSAKKLHVFLKSMDAVEAVVRRCRRVGEDVVITVEGQFVGVNKKGALSLADAAGIVKGYWITRGYSVSPPLPPQAWINDMMRVKGARCPRRKVYEPVMYTLARDVLGREAENKHIAAAACMLNHVRGQYAAEIRETA